MTAGTLEDSFGRVIRDLRISVTDRCNFRCLYCLPDTEEAARFYRKSVPAQPVSPVEWKPREALLQFEEIVRLSRIFLGLGVRKIRITGGEPLLRRQLPELIAELNALPGLEDLAMTTNGFFFPAQAEALVRAGLRRVSFSLDSLDRETFRKMTGRDSLETVLESIGLAQRLGLNPVKINAVVIRDLNDGEIESLAERALEERWCLRFIEFMPLDQARSWQRELVVPADEILERLSARFRVEPLPLDNPSSTARRYALEGGRAEVGLIAPVSRPFCGQCNRIRLTSDGQVRTCLFSLNEHDLKGRMRAGETDEALADWLGQVVLGKEAGHRVGQPDFEQPKRSMSCIGG